MNKNVEMKMEKDKSGDKKVKRYIVTGTLTALGIIGGYVIGFRSGTEAQCAATIFSMLDAYGFDEGQKIILTMNKSMIKLYKYREKQLTI